MVRRLSSPLLRNVFAVASGTALAQVIVFAFSPLITRIYSPEVFGLQGVFMSLVSILSPVISLRYPMAIVTAETEDEMLQLARLSLIVTAVLSCALGLLLVAGGAPLAAVFGAEGLGLLIYLLPVATCFVAIQDVADYRAARLGAFRLVGKVTAIVAFVTSLAKVLSGLAAPVAATLIVFNGLAPAFKAALLQRGTKSLPVRVPRLGRAKMFTLLKKYRDFPIYRAPTDLLNAVSQALPVILLAALFSPLVAGFFVLARSVTNLPMNVLGVAIGNVLYAKFADMERSKQPLFPLVFKITVVLLCVPGTALAAAALFFPALFSFVFGEVWRASGEYAMWMSLWLICMLVNIPTVRALPVIQRQGLHLVFNIVIFGAGGMSFLAGYMIEQTPLAAVIWFSIGTASALVIQIITYLVVILLHDQIALGSKQ
ncbi:lipopolysaccharide biosynthesis protein [Pseudorhodobacter ferrugineus]|uniref:lipopolysaccharide biosynthesis protein n=1 Tax=Pseudorhodobacter ferrugineus TaxID=77008 RepID=UPI000416E0F5|nr:oligosaccharide flippase family protein [Pseudorhodobacter ferrugineus]